MQPTWAEIFRRLDMEWCQECANSHEGTTTLTGTDLHPVLHWRNRRIGYPSIYKALNAIARYERYAYYEGFPEGAPRWLQSYYHVKVVQALAKKARVRLPRKLFDLDRARLRYQLSQYRLEARRQMSPSDQRDFRAAVRWAARS